jgi:hypothetical protein
VSRIPRGRATLALSLLLPLLIYSAWAVRFLRAGVGYEYDEALWVESAVYMLRGGGTPPFAHEPASWVSLAGRRWPLMILPYEGAAKALVALPLFAALGIHTEVARLSSVLLGYLGIAGLVTLIGTRASPVAGLLVGVLLALHPSYLDLTVFDNGGTAVWMASMGLIALALTHHLRRGSFFSAFLVGVATGIGVWARANVLWLLAAAAAAGLIVFGRRALPRAAHAGALLMGGVLGGAPLLVYEMRSGLGTLGFIRGTRAPLSASLLAERLRALADVMVSDREQKIVWGGPEAEPWELSLGAGLLALTLLAVFVPLGSRDPERSRWRRAFAVAALVLAGIVVTSRLHIQQHHLVGVLPLAFSAVTILAVEWAERSRAARAALAACAVGLAALFLSWDLRIDRGIRETGGRRVFSSAIEDVSRYVASHGIPPDRLKILNWGFQNNLYVLSGGRVYGAELFGGPSKAVSRRGLTWEDEIRDGGAFLVFEFPMGPPLLSDAAAGFREALARHRGPYREERFVERSGIPYARIVEIEPAR